MVQNGNRKRAIRALMAETGMNYTRAMRELDRQRAEQAASQAEAGGSEAPEERAG